MGDAEERATAVGGICVEVAGAGVCVWLLEAPGLRRPQPVNTTTPSRPILCNSFLLVRSTSHASACERPVALPALSSLDHRLEQPQLLAVGGTDGDAEQGRDDAPPQPRDVTVGHQRDAGRASVDIVDFVPVVWPLPRLAPNAGRSMYPRRSERLHSSAPHRARGMSASSLRRSLHQPPCLRSRASTVRHYPSR